MKTLVRAIIGRQLVAVVAFLTRLSEAVAAARQSAMIGAAVGVIQVGIVTFFDPAMGKAVTADCVFTSCCAGVGVQRVAIVALFARLDDAVAAAIHDAAVLDAANMVRIFSAKGAAVFGCRARRLAILSLALPASEQ